MSRIQELEAEIAALREENTRLRGLHGDTCEKCGVFGPVTWSEETSQYTCRKCRENYRSVASMIFAEKDAQYTEIKKSGEWPCKSCRKCVAQGACCSRDWHHIGDCCLHCGNDEREVKK